MQTVAQRLQKLDEFTLAYIECMLWSSHDWTDPDDSCPPNLDENFDPTDLAPETLDKIEEDCTAFQREHWEDIASNPSRAGCDFWLTRNGHGAGFWDGGWPEEIGKRLTDASKVYGELDPYPGDNGLIYF